MAGVAVAHHVRGNVLSAALLHRPCLKAFLDLPLSEPRAVFAGKKRSFAVCRHAFGQIGAQGFKHPVLDDPELTTWQAYTARAWPTLVVIDPEGYIVTHLSGEEHVQGLISLVRELVAEHEEKGTLHRGDGPYVPRPKTEGTFAFPGKAIEL